MNIVSKVSTFSFGMLVCIIYYTVLKQLFSYFIIYYNIVGIYSHC